MRSIFWVSAFFCIAFASANIVELFFVDFVHGNPHRTQANAVEMMLFISPVLGIIASVGALLVFTLPTCWQALLLSASGRMAIQRPGLVILAALPVTAILTWYCWEYLTPTDMNLGINVGPDWRPYQHGITLTRYLHALAYQAPVTIFQAAYCNVHLRPWSCSRDQIVLVAIILAVVAGGARGYFDALEQYRFL